jgi:hypothetical protein
MKKIILTMLSCLLCICVFAQGQPAFMKQLVPDKRIFDFGNIYEKNGKVSHVFVLKNTGSKPLAITDVNSWCGCTTANYTKRAILPGKTGEVTVTYNPYSRPGRFSKEVVLLLNDGKFYIRLWLKGNVIHYLHPVTEDYPYAFGSGLYMGYKMLPFAEMKKGQSYTFQQRIANNTDKPMTVVFRRVPNNRVLKMPDVIRLKPNERTTFNVSYKAIHEYPFKRYINIYPIVNGKRVKPLKVVWLGKEPEKFRIAD